MRDRRTSEVAREAAGTEALWTVKEVASYFQVSHSWVYHRAEAGLLPCVRIGALLRFHAGAIRALARGESAVVVRHTPAR